jgi:hypothetical protein
MIKDLGWHLGPAQETGGVARGNNESEPAWLFNGTGWIMNKLATIRDLKQKVREEQFAAVQERLAMLDDGLATAEACLAEKREAELRAWVKVIEQWLPVIVAQIGLLCKTVTGIGRPMPSEMQLTTTGNEMTVEEHVETTKTHLRYAEGHLQPLGEHLVDAEVHLKLVSAHLAALEPAGQAVTRPVEMVTLPAPETGLEKTQTRGFLGFFSVHEYF